MTPLPPLAAGLLRRLALLALLLGSGLLGSGPARAADAVLLASTAPGYAPGMAIAASDPLMLPEGASVTLLFRSGQMLRLRGPFEGTLERLQPSAKTSVPALAQMFRLQGVDASVIGGTRTAGSIDVAGLAQDVAVEPLRSATYCLGPADAVWIRHPAAGGAYGLRRRAGTRAITFPAGAERIEWPADVPIEDGDRFELVADGQVHATLGFHLLEASYPSAAAWVAAGILAGCHEQFDPELRRLGQESVPPELWLTSSHGRTPVYRAGEPIGLTVQADADGYLYCVVQRSDGNAVPLFPAGAVDGPRLRNAVPIAIPGERRRGAVLAGPPGTAQVACWLADRDISPELPHALLDPGAGRLPERLAAELDSVFAGVDGRALPKAVLTIRVE
jgi:hypothetical protein